MADFAAVLRRTIDGLSDPTPEMRQKVYEKARATVAAKLAAMNPPPAPAAAERQKKLLEDAIREVEADFAPAIPAADPLAELENVFASLGDAPVPEPVPARTAGASFELKDAGDDVLGPIPPQPAEQTAHSQPERREEPVLPRPLPGFAGSTTAAGSPAAGQSGNGWGRTEERPSQAALRPAAPSPRPESKQESDVRLSGSDTRGEREDDRDIVDPDRDDDLTRRREDAPRSKFRFGRALAALVIVAALGGGAYALWENREAVKSFAGLDQADRGPQQAEAPPQAAEPDGSEPPADAAEAPAEATPAPEATPEQPPKFTQRLNPDGTEVDEGPAGGEQSLGEGTSVAAATQPPSAPATPAPGADQSVPVGQRAIFYEERTNIEQGSADTGSIVWSLVQESPGGDLPPEPAIRAEATIPDKDLQLRMTIRRNGDPTLPASHIIEMIFLTPDGFEGGGIDNVLRVSMKDSEQAAGSPLLGIPAKIADGFFLIALSDGQAESQANLTLLRRQSWIDVPMVYKSGRRALITLEKGIPGDKVFDDALRAWEAKTAG